MGVVGKFPQQSAGVGGQQAFLTRPAAPGALSGQPVPGTPWPRWLCLLQCLGWGGLAKQRPSLPHGWIWVASARCSWAISGKPLDLCTGPSVPSDGQATSHVKGGAALSAAGGPEPRAGIVFPAVGKVASVPHTKGFPVLQHFLFPAYFKPSRDATWEKDSRQRAESAGSSCGGPVRSTPRPTPGPGLLLGCCCHSGLGTTVVRGWGLSAPDLAGPFPGSPIPLQP